MGSHYLNLSNRAVGIRKEVVLSIRPVKGESVKEFTVDAFNKLNSSGQNPIERISVQGKDDENGDVFLNT
ncbi:MAG: hypothetical protein ABIP51_02245, partial [Bacteroidia bacterium]